MHTIECKICKFQYGSWRLHCPACSTLSVNFAGRKWSTEKDGAISKEVGRARSAFPVEQVFQTRIRTQTVD